MVFPKRKKGEEAKWLSEETLKITEKRRGAKGKGENEGHIHLNTVPKKRKEIRKPS